MSQHPSGAPTYSMALGCPCHSLCHHPYPVPLSSPPWLLETGHPKPSVITLDSHAKPKTRTQGPLCSSREQLAPSFPRAF